MTQYLRETGFYHVYGQKDFQSDNNQKGIEKAKKILKFRSKSGGKRKDSPKGQIIDEGSLGKLKYRVFKRGNVHIFNKAETLLFKKDCDVFDSEVDELNLNSLKDGENTKIEGSGENDTLVFACIEGDIEISLEKRAYNMLTKLKNILTKRR